ncbi:MAG TPA: hypothetical protein VM282_19900 [Acidimicrobiales bacterium]|nr:hypothetical protein [Acidimicrobiales bacterium]
MLEILGHLTAAARQDDAQHAEIHGSEWNRGSQGSRTVGADQFEIGEQDSIRRRLFDLPVSNMHRDRAGTEIDPHFAAAGWKEPARHRVGVDRFGQLVRAQLRASELQLRNLDDAE